MSTPSSSTRTSQKAAATHVNDKGTVTTTTSAATARLKSGLDDGFERAYVDEKVPIDLIT